MMTFLTVLSLLGTAHADTPDTLEGCLAAFAFESIEIDDGPIGPDEYGRQCRTDTPWHGNFGYVIIPPLTAGDGEIYEGCLPFAYGITTCDKASNEVSDTNNAN